MSGGGGSGGGGNQTTVTRQEMPAEAKGYYNLYARDVHNLSNLPYQRYGGQRIADMTGEQNLGLNRIADRATQGSPLIAGAEKNVMSTLRGDFLDPATNPGFNMMADRVAQAYNRNTRAPSDFGFARANAFGPENSAWNEMNRTHNAGLADAIGSLAYQNYGAERGRQMDAIGQAQGLADQPYRDAQALIGVGDVRRENTQDRLNMDYQDWLEQMNHPYRQADLIGNIVKLGMGGGGTTTTEGYAPSYKPNRLASGLGGAATGFSLGGPWGAAAGGLGGLLGLF